MADKIIAGLGINSVLVILFLFLLLVFIMLISLNMKYNRLKRSYSRFMRGNDGRNLEEFMIRKFKEIDELTELTKKNQTDIKKIYSKIRKNYQKSSIVKYDAFEDIGGNLSFVLTMLDEDDNGWIFNAMHSGRSCYTYIKEVVKGQSYIELSEEEKQCLEQAIVQDLLT